VKIANAVLGQEVLVSVNGKEERIYEHSETENTRSSRRFFVLLFILLEDIIDGQRNTQKKIMNLQRCWAITLAGRAGDLNFATATLDHLWDL
jgi:hypothetical protein